MKLVTVLLFVMVMTWLLLSEMETNLLAVKMSNYFGDKIITFEAAEAGLLMQESRIQHNPRMLPPLSASIVTGVKLIDEDECYKERFQISSTATYRKSKVTLESIYDYLPQPNIHCMTEKINRRIFWRVVSS